VIDRPVAADDLVFSYGLHIDDKYREYNSVYRGQVSNYLAGVKSSTGTRFISRRARSMRPSH